MTQQDLPGTSLRRIGLIASVVLLLAASVFPPTRVAGQHDNVTLKDAFKKHFLIGAALNRNQFSEKDTRGVPIVTMQFNTITAENQLKWQNIHPQPDKFDFEGADQFVAFGEKYKMVVIGHTLVWHNQTPKWVFQDAAGGPISRDALLKRLREHIHTVVGRYKGRIKGWDVVNEAINDDGTMRQSEWLKIIGDDYIVKAFQYAHEADPNAELYYNDYDLEDPPKRKGAIELIKKLKAAGVAIQGVGLQAHSMMDWPSVAEQEQTILDFANLGLRVHITEMDLEMLPRKQKNQDAETSSTVTLDEKWNPYAKGLPDDVAQAQAQRYADLFAVFVKHSDKIDRVTFWGVTDGDSWLNNWPIRGRTNYPLLFDRTGKPKPAFSAVIKTAGH
jgi:endo-1,4-beta-xylanase